MMDDITWMFSMRGRKYLAYAAWKKKGITNVITHYLNKQKDNIIELWGWDGKYYFPEYFTALFTAVDFHEWLHIFIRRESGVKKTYIVTKEHEKFIGMCEDALICCLASQDDSFSDREPDLNPMEDELPIWAFKPLPTTLETDTRGEE